MRLRACQLDGSGHQKQRSKARVENRTKLVSITSAGEDVLENMDPDLEYRKNQLKRLQEEVVDLEEINGGINIMDLGLNEFHLDVKELRDKYGDADYVPFGINATATATEDAPAGVIYILNNINSNVEVLQTTIAKVGTVCEDNSATTEALAAGMQEAADTTDLINANVTTMVQNADQINDLSEQGANHAVEIKNKAEGIRQDVQSSISTAKEIFEDVKRQSDEAIEQSKAVDKINELTETIRSIAGQTNLLAASICDGF